MSGTDKEHHVPKNQDPPIRLTAAERHTLRVALLEAINDNVALIDVYTPRHGPPDRANIRRVKAHIARIKKLMAKFGLAQNPANDPFADCKPVSVADLLSGRVQLPPDPAPPPAPDPYLAGIMKRTDNQ